MNFSGKFGSDQTIWYPASGFRYRYDGRLFDVGSKGNFWSASPYHEYNAYCLGFFYYNGSFSPSGYADRASGQAVRCVKE